VASRSPEALAPVASALQEETARAIRAWIVAQDLAPGHHLKEHDLCGLLRLSRSPIRAALGLLAGDGVLSRREGGGYVLAVSGWDLGEREDGATALDELYRRIAGAWFAGAIPPQVSTAEIQRRFGVTSGEAQRALGRLAADGVVERTAGKGWRLGPNLATEKDFADSYRFRLIVEPAAILCESFALPAPKAARVRRRHERILAEGAASVREMVDADLEFHGLVAASCGNRFLAQAIERQNLLRRLTEMLSTPDGGRLRASCREHLGILSALEDGRAEIAAALMREHLTVSRGFAPDFAGGAP
jgi:DNA-binding GntR family transcriptional regulator